MKQIFAGRFRFSLLALLFFLTNMAVLVCTVQLIASVAHPLVAAVKSSLPLVEQRLLSGH